MPMYQVQHYRTIKTAVGLKNVGAHNSRAKVYDKDGNEIINEQIQNQKGEDLKWYDPSMSSHNIYDKDKTDILKKRNDRIKNAKLLRKPQKNAAVAIEGVFSASHEWKQKFKENPEDRELWKKYLDKSRAWAEKEFGKENILQCDVHFDEKTPHMHLLIVPIKEGSIKRKGHDGPLNGNVYSSSSFLGNRTGLRRLHDEYHKNVGQDFSLERGVPGSRAKHQELVEYWKKEKEINQRIDALSSKEKTMSEREDVLQKNSDEIKMLNAKFQLIAEAVVWGNDKALIEAQTLSRDILISKGITAPQVLPDKFTDTAFLNKERDRTESKSISKDMGINW